MLILHLFSPQNHHFFTHMRLKHTHTHGFFRHFIKFVSFKQTTNIFLNMKKTLITAALISLCSFAAQSSVAQEKLKFDFGSTETQDGFVAVTSSTLYSDQTGYGFEASEGITDVVNKKGTAITKDFVTAEKPFKFSVKLPEGNYKVTVTLGDTRGTSKTTIKTEIRRLMVEGFETAKKTTEQVSFNANVRTPKLSQDNYLKLNTSELDYATGAIKKAHWDDKLTIQFNDERPCVCAIEIEPLNDVITVFTIGDSTVTDQAGGGTWAQYLPRWFGEGVVVANHAESGQTIKGFRFSRRWDKVLESAKEGDYLFIQLGTNDQKSRGHDPMWPEKDQGGNWSRTHSDPETDYVWELATMAVEAKRHGIIPVIVSPMTKINRRDGSATDLMTPYGENAVRAAELADCAYINLWAMSMDIVAALGEGALKVYSDGTHTDDYGGYLFSLCIAKGIKENGLDLQKYFVEDLIDLDPKNPVPFEEFKVALEPKQPRPQSAPKLPEGMTPQGPL